MHAQTRWSHCIVSFAAWAAYGFIYTNEPCLRDLDVIERITPRLNKTLHATVSLFDRRLLNGDMRMADRAQDYQDSEPDFFSHPACRSARKAIAAHPLQLPSSGHIVPPGTAFGYKATDMHTVQFCVVRRVSETEGGCWEYDIQHLPDRGPEDRSGNKKTLSEDEFRAMPVQRKFERHPHLLSRFVCISYSQCSVRLRCAKTLY